MNSYALKDIETGEQLHPVYLAITCSKTGLGTTQLGNRFDFDSNSVTSRVNVHTFGKDCLQSIFYNDMDGLNEKFPIPDQDKQSTEGIYYVWSITKKPEDHYGGNSYVGPNGSQDLILGRALIGVLLEDQIEKYLPNTAKDLKAQKVHFRVRSLERKLE